MKLYLQCFLKLVSKQNEKVIRKDNRHIEYYGTMLPWW